MSSSFTINKEKRPRSPNDADNSFVKNVTSRMTALLPSTITKWFSSPSSSNTNGSAPIAESTDSSTEDEAPESPITTQPPAKRMRFSSPGTSNTYIAPETKCTSTNTESIGTFSEIQSPMNRSAFNTDSNFESTRVHPPAEELTVSAIQKDTSIYSLESSVNDNSSVLKKRKSLFDLNHEENYVRNTDANLKGPHFNPSLYASPFYNRRTKYGGASSSYINQPNIKHRKNTSVTNYSNNDNITISHSARRVLDLLENYSSPLMEAKRISQFMKTSNNSSLNSSMDSSIENNSNRLSYKTQELHVPSIATILRLKQKSRLMDTTSAARQIIASHSSSSDFMPYPVQNSQSNTNSETTEKLTTKIKSRLTRINREEKATYENNEPINLPTAVLQIDKDNLPKFSLGIPTPKPVSSSTITNKTTVNKPLTNASPPVSKLPSNNSIKINEVSVKKIEKIPNNNYQFSSPVTVSNEMVKSSSPPKFSFGSPERSIEKISEISNENRKAQSQPIQEKTVALPHSENWKCDDCWVSNKSDATNCVCCGGKKPTKDKMIVITCSVCKVSLSQGYTKNKCIDCEKKYNNIKVLNLPSVDSPKWKCQDCWVQNDAGVDKCVCCGGKKSIEVSNIKSIPENVESTWKCEECLVRNNGKLDICSACETARPSSKLSDTKANESISQTKTPTNDSLLKKIIKSQTDKWECVNCLVRNDSNVSKCVCCETEKPGTIKESEKKSFNFGVNPNMFKFGIDPKQNVAENKETKPSLLASPSTLVKPTKEFETNNNILSTTFTFGLPKKKPDDKSNKEEEKLDAIPSPAFTFGIPKQISTEPNATSKLKPPGLVTIQPKETEKAENKKDEPKQSTKIEQPVPKLSDRQSPVGLFVAPVSSEPAMAKTTDSPVSNIIPTNVSEKNESVNNHLLISTLKSTTATILPQNTFSFSSGGLKPATNLFATPETTISTTSTSFTPLQEPPVSSSISFFPKNNPVNSSPLSFFQKNESTPTTLSLFSKTETIPTTTVSQPEVSTTPVFSFGSSNVQATTQPEKPKFNFTFGSNNNKSDTSTVFKPIFGATADSNIGTNNFALSNSNSMSTENVLSGNTLGNIPNTNTMPGNILSGGNNGLSTSNPLGGLSVNNALASGNNLGGNVLSTNSLPSTNNMAQSSNSSVMQPGGLFGTPIKKDNNMWSANNTSNNLFVSNNNVQKPSFNFGSSVSFNSNTANPAPTFGTPSQPTQNMFGMPSQNNQPTLFSNPMQNSTPPNIFGAPQPASNPVPTVGMFGTPNVGATPTFGSPNHIPTFEAPAMNPTPAPTFNFGAQQPTGIFGFGQQPQQPQQQQQPPPPQQQQGGVYNFGATPAAMNSQVQFNMGSSPYISGRRVRKAIRRTSQR